MADDKQIHLIVSRYHLLLLIKAITSAQFSIEDEKEAFALANKLKTLAQ